MEPFFRGFAAELVKVAAPDAEDFRDAKRDAIRDLAKKDGFTLRGGGAPVKRDYLASTILSAVSIPIMAILGKKIGRALHNREVRRLMHDTVDPMKLTRLKDELQMGKLIGRARPDLPANHRPLISHGDLISDAAKGAVAGSVLQMIRDRVSGSGKK